MSTSYKCGTCGEVHEGVPFTWGLAAPSQYELPSDEREDRAEISSDQCIIDDAQFFVLGRIEIPVLDSPDNFYWLAWVQLTEADFERASELWHAQGREIEPPYPGQIASVLRAYSVSTFGLSVQLHTQPVGERPLIELGSSAHPLVMEQLRGISVARVREIAEQCLHA